MKPNKTMCQDQDLARLNRERVKTNNDLAYWESQARAVAQWAWGEPKPESVVLGDLPYVGRYKSDTELDRD